MMMFYISSVLLTLGSCNCKASAASAVSPHKLDRPSLTTYDYDDNNQYPSAKAVTPDNSAMLPWEILPSPAKEALMKNGRPSTIFQLFNGDLYEIEVDAKGKPINTEDEEKFGMIAGSDGNTTTSSSSSSSSEQSTTTSSSAQRQKDVWDLVATFDSYKNSDLYALDGSGNPTLSVVRYIVLAIWWDGEDTTNPGNAIDLIHIDTIM